MAKTKKLPRGFWIIFAILAATALIMIGQSDVPRNSPEQFLPEITVFFASHPEFGTPVGKVDMPDWASGKRQRIQTTKGKNLLFYIQSGRVVTVYEDQAEGRKKVWGDFAK